MELLEREHEVAKLGAAFAAASTGQGSVVLVSGEAGIGKTSFVEHFITVHARSARVLKGNCDALFTPSPLAPLYDIARQFKGGSLLGQLESGSGRRPALFSALLELLQGSAQPVILIIEDIHWADEATLDLVRYLSRRITSARVLLIATHRDDEIGRQHPLRMLLGSLAGARSVHRIQLARFSVDAVRKLVADSALDVEALHRQTGGNPFFVSEIIAISGRGIPATVRDAVLARTFKLKSRSRNLLELAAVIGARIEHRIIEQVFPRSPDGLADCIEAGMLQADTDGVTFRHELAREAVLESIDPLRRRTLYRTVLKAASNWERPAEASWRNSRTTLRAGQMRAQSLRMALPQPRPRCRWARTGKRLRNTVAFYALQMIGRRPSGRAIYRGTRKNVLRSTTCTRLSKPIGRRSRSGGRAATV